MQSKTSCCNKAVFRKNFTRFAPVWGLYTLALVMGLFMMMDSDRVNQFGFNLTGLPAIMSLINCGYALLIAQLLFGDLYASRSCYALHAMPLRRETWYVTNVLSGLVFSLIPTAVMTLVALPMMVGGAVVNGWQMPLYIFVGVNLQYILFFGMAVLCSFCAGNRLGMIACYGVLNFAAWGIAAAVEMMYAPMLYGVINNGTAYMPFFPLGEMIDSSHAGLLEIENFSNLINQWRMDDMAYNLVLNFTLGDGWGYYFAAAGAGLAFLVAGLLLYRNRRLESAGDLLAVKILEPVFQVIVTLACGAAFQVVYLCVGTGAGNASYDGIRGVVQGNAYYAFLAIGLVVGWFGGKMLLERSTTVFQKKNIPGLLALFAVAALSLVLTALDPMGFVTWVPKAEEVKSVSLSESEYWVGTPMEREGDTEKLIQLHEQALNSRVMRKEIEETENGYRDYTRFSLTYTLNSGKTARRSYEVPIDGETGEILKTFRTRPEVVLSDYDGVPIELDKIHDIYVHGVRKSLSFTDQEDIDGLLDAIIADCEEGTMASDYRFHQGYFTYENDPERLDASVDVTISTDIEYGRTVNIQVFPESRHTLQWLKDHDPEDRLGFTINEGDYYTAWEALREKLGKDY